MKKTINHEKLIQVALRQYGMINYSSSFIRHNDNLILKIDNHESGTIQYMDGACHLAKKYR